MCILVMMEAVESNYAKKHFKKDDAYCKNLSINAIL